MARSLHAARLVLLIWQVRASDGHALSPAFAAGLSAWARRHKLLLCEDAVLLGLRCGATSFCPPQP
eukprot:1761106-Prymnesium_polylepis.1